jgi:two-component system nitrogen regulation response regulator NtrX
LPSERILIVDDEINIANSLKDILSDEGYEVSIVADGKDALERIQADPPDVVLLDIWLPGMDGIEVLKKVKADQPDVEILIMSGHGTIDTAVKATKLGAFDFIEKPFSLDHLTQTVENVIKHKKNRLQQNGRTSPERQFPLYFELVGNIYQSIQNAAQTELPLLILGERGTGKELAAQTIHRLSPHKNSHFIKVNCSARKMEDIRSQVFSEGSATAQDKVVYLTNIESLSEELQDELAEALGKNQKEASNLLPIVVFLSSSKDLQALVDQGQFKKDLLVKFKDSTLTIPPLRDNTGTIPLIVQDYFRKYARRTEILTPTIEEEVLQVLWAYNWPGNIKELRTVLDRILVLGSSQETIAVSDLPSEIKKPQASGNPNDFEQFTSLEEAELNWEKGFLIHHLRKNEWDIDRTASALKTNKALVEEKLRLHSIQVMDSPENQAGQVQRLQRTLKRSVVLCGSGLHSGIKTGLILQPLPANSGIIFGDISTGQTIPAQLENVESTDYSTCLKKGLASVATIEHIMAVLHMYKITNLLIKVGDEAPVMDGSARDFCDLIEDGEFEEQDGMCDEIVIDKLYQYGAEDGKGPHITIEPSDKFRVTYHMDYPEPIGVQEYTYEFNGENSFKEEIAPARTFGFLEDVAQLTKMGFATGGKLDNFILLGDKRVLNTKLRFENEFSRHKILDVLGDFYLLGKPIRGHIKAHLTGHRHNVALLAKVRDSLTPAA